MKVGASVIALQDGKLSRSYTGIVTKTHNGHHLTVKIDDGAETLLVRLRKIPRKHGRPSWRGGLWQVGQKILKCSVLISSC